MRIAKENQLDFSAKAGQKPFQTEGKNGGDLIRLLNLKPSLKCIDIYCPDCGTCIGYRTPNGKEVYYKNKDHICEQCGAHACKRCFFNGCPVCEH